MRYLPLDRLEEIETAIAQEIRCGTRTRQRDAIAVALGLHGLRVGEVVRAQVSHFTPALGQLHVPTIKGGLPRDVRLHESLAAALVAWRAKHAPAAGPLLVTAAGRAVHRTAYQRAARRLTERVLGTPLRFHALRHTHAMRLLDLSGDQFLVRRQLGHRSITSTQVYADTLAQVPDEALVRLDRGELVPPAGLRIWSPADHDPQETRCG